MMFEHIPVLLEECLEGLDIKPDGIYLDGTLGGGGHSTEILKRLNGNGLLIGIDQDATALAAAEDKLKLYGRKLQNEAKYTKDKIIKSTKDEMPYYYTVKANFEEMESVIRKLNIDSVDGILLDIGVSSHQFDEAERGFSYRFEGPLDMRMNKESNLSAEDVVNDYSEKSLVKIIRDYGEEKWAVRIASFIVEYRKRKRISTTQELFDIIKAAVPKDARRDGPHPARRTFQAIRIEVNSELEVLKNAINKGAEILKTNGRICIISFHSLEDRIVKTEFKRLANPCTCPPDFPVCVCGKVPVLKVVNGKPIEAGESELRDNPRSRSAKLRIAKKV